MASERFGKAWIVGASSGIGRALALELARHGVACVVSARSEAGLHETVRQDAALEGRLVPLALDVTDADAVREAADRAEALLGGLDLVVACAGTHLPFGAANFSPAKFRTLIEVNLIGTINLLAAVMPRFIERRRGHIAVVSSVAGYRGLPTAAAYGATKAALINLCESLKFDLDRANVRLQLISPGFVETPLTDRNEFPMPFLMQSDAAARRFYDGLHSDRFEVTFPKRFTWQMKLLRILPYRAYFAIVRRITGRQPAPRS